MFQLLESIRIENRKLYHIERHNCRLNMARKMVFGIEEPIDLNQVIQLPTNLLNLRYKCRVTTNGERIEIKITPYVQREIRSLMLVHANNIDYTYKSDQRYKLDQAFAQRGNCDDIIIIKNGYLTDAWAANIILYNGKTWHTPSSPLLKGIQREYLLQNGHIKEKKIHYSMLRKYKKVKLINALIDFERAPEIEISSIFTANY